MAQADGRVIIDSKLDTTGVEKGFLKLKTDAKSLTTSMSDAGNEMGGFSSKTKALGKGLLSIGKAAAVAGAAIVTALGAAVVSLTKKSTSAYADYEQLVGGVETLFKNSANTLLKYAEDAFFTVGISANEYMETATSFSASLISSLSGDTEKAAEIANMAMVDMADNANKMGTSMDAIQNAYQGFAKQNYTMLDNLKLGYGGTKTEMERLLTDAQKLTGQKYDISNLSDVYSAIHAIQTQLGIAGTTAKEAEETITGSANMTKAAWENVLAAISGGGDLDKAINNLVYSLTKYFDNIVPVVQKSIAGIGDLIAKIAPQLVQTVATALIQAIPQLLVAVYQMIIGFAQGIYQGIIALFSGKTVKSVTASLNNVTSAAGASGNALSDAAASAGDLATETEKAGNAAKKSIAGFDELNVLGNGSTGGTTGDTRIGGISATAPGITIETEAAEESSSVLVSIFENLKKKIEEYASLFQPTFDAWSNSFSTMGESLKPSVEKIKSSFETLKTETLPSILSCFTETFVPGMVNAASTNLAPVFTDVLSLAVSGFAIDFQNATLAISEYGSILEGIFDRIKTVFSDMCSSIKEKWDEYSQPIQQGFIEFKNGIWETFWDIYNKIVRPIFENCAKTFDWLWEEHLKPLWDNIVEFALSLYDNILTLWNRLLKPIVDWVVAFLAPIIVDVVNGIWDAISIAVAFISDLISYVIKYLDGVITFLVGVFTLDIDKALSGVKKIFSATWNGIISVVKTAINSVIWAINKMISGIYSGIAAVVNGIGSIVKSVGKMLGHNWGFSIPTAAPKIPYLAQGAVLPANKPFLAMVGDQKHGTNIEAPLSTIQEAVAEVLGDQMSGMMAGFEALLEENRRLRAVVENIEVGDSTIGQAAARYQARAAVINGGV